MNRLRLIPRLKLLVPLLLIVLASCNPSYSGAEPGAVDTFTLPSMPEPEGALPPDIPSRDGSSALNAYLARSTPALISYGEVVTGEISDENPYEQWTFLGTAGDVISVGMLTTRGDLDTLLLLLNSAGSTIASDDDSGHGTNSTIISYRLDASESYTIVATRYSGSGMYDLLVYKESRP